ncbi:MAG: hypothetical protein OSB67_05205 [Alphaproteobacteria bacterium]|nr:hypothetical protein [Alphaproteobacteria bacterium]
MKGSKISDAGLTSDQVPWETMLERTKAKEHLACQRMLEDTDVMFAAGPMAEDNC